MENGLYHGNNLEENDCVFVRIWPSCRYETLLQQSLDVKTSRR
jgi:hypothetical protein